MVERQPNEVHTREVSVKDETDEHLAMREARSVCYGPEGDTFEVSICAQRYIALPSASRP